MDAALVVAQLAALDHRRQPGSLPLHADTTLHGQLARMKPGSDDFVYLSHAKINQV